MTDTFKLLSQVSLSTADTLIYTAPANSKVIIRHIRVVNTNISTDHTVKMFHNPAGEAGLNAVDDVILPFVTIDGGGWGEFEGTIILEGGGATFDTLYGLQGEGPANEVTVTLYGLVIT